MEVAAFSRLHMGFYRFLDLKLAYGSIGVSLERPRFRAKVVKSEDLEVRAPDAEISKLIEDAISKLSVPGAKVEVLECIPLHVGLGATTQTSLAVAYALNEIYGLGHSIEELAVILGRGFNSGIGIWTFKLGGLIVDSGRRCGAKLSEVKCVEDLPKVLARVEVPSNWIFVVAVPRSFRGRDEGSERGALERPRPLPRQLQSELYRLLLSGLLPSALSGDLRAFGAALSRIQEIVGDYFSIEQGGRFCCKETSEAIEVMERLGAAGVGQSSWGPCCYGIVEDLSQAMNISRGLAAELDVDVAVTNARNRGFEVCRQP